MTPYRGQRYQLQEWRAGNAPTKLNDFLNMKHSFAQNVIERAFGLLKDRWAILCEKSYYSVQVHCRTIIVCCLQHNLINRKVTNVNILDDVDEGGSNYATTGGDNINYIEASNE